MATTATTIPEDYLERVYAGVLGKLIGVYLGRPFEGWTHQRILEELGPIKYYVHEKVGAPLVVTDDDVSGTFTFVRALEEHFDNRDHGDSGRQGDGDQFIISAEAIGKTWLNNVIEKRTIFWWGGRGISTEHTAFLNLKNGIPAPQSGAIATNGRTVAEQIGAQIFIDGWAMVAPGNPALAARLAEAAGSVSHDGESVYAAKLWAAMEAEAFVSRDVDHLLDTGLEFIPEDSLIARLIRDVRAWVREDGGNWMKTRQRIEDVYGYDKFSGVCHVVPNHGIMVMALLYGGHDFDEALHIINTSGWDTDCNSGNVACLVAIMHGLEMTAFARPSSSSSRDWRGPLADRALISSADGGYTINDAARIAYDIADMGRRLAGLPVVNRPKAGAQFHFSLPGSVQGFHALVNGVEASAENVAVGQGIDRSTGNPALRVSFGSIGAKDDIEILTHTFLPPEVKSMPTYEIGGSPLVYPGQTLEIAARSDETATSGAVLVQLVLKVYNSDDVIVTVVRDEPAVALQPGQATIIRWTVPDDFGNQPIQAMGLKVTGSDERGLPSGRLWIDYLRWDGAPRLRLKPEARKPNEFWHRAFVNGADDFRYRWGRFSIVQNRGEGTVAYGTRQWTDYNMITEKFTINIGGPSGVIIRAQGLNRYYALVFSEGGRMSLVKALDEQRIVLRSVAFDWKLDVPYVVRIGAKGGEIEGQVEEVRLSAHDDQYRGGGCGFVVTDGSVRADSIEIM